MVHDKYSSKFRSPKEKQEMGWVNKYPEGPYYKAGVSVLKLWQSKRSLALTYW